MSQPPPASRPLYISAGGDSIFAFLHEASVPRRDSAVLMCPPFGWEDMCSYRSQREWATALAAEGFATLRIDFPGSGDSSGGPRDPHRVRAWTEAIAAAARWLASATGAERIVAIGIGLGGTLACHAVSQGAPIDDLVLWGAAARGRSHVRELRAFSRMESTSEEQLESTPSTQEAPDDDSLAVAGYVLSGETQRELDELDLSELECPHLGSARVLMLDRDGRAVDPRLQAALERCGAEVTLGDGEGYAAMMMGELPHAVSAHAVFASVSEWLAGSGPTGEEHSAPALGATPVNGAATSAPEPAVYDSVEISLPNGTHVRETPIAMSHPLGDPIGILTEPVGSRSDLCAVWLNAGPQRRIGPNRMWVETARRWAAQGVPTFRVDLAGIGDAEGDSGALVEIASYYTPAYLEQVRLVLDTLQARGLPPRFLLGGLCAGGYWALHIAQEDARVCAAAVLNPGYLVYDGGLSNAVGQTRSLASRLFQRSTWRRVLHGQVTPSAHLSNMRTLLAALGRAVLHLPVRIFKRGGDDRASRVARAFDVLRGQDQRALVLFAGDERLHSELFSSGRLTDLSAWPNVTVRHIAVAGDMHTLRPLPMQQQANQLVDELLRGELERVADVDRPRGDVEAVPAK
ncbi:MAG TPA: alpha/beta fold hydrolase [Solirubrobacteraceae bacterium]|nr:alpha/beta fold hydrolase [Solirubrobacteraceae bacterium]